MKNIFRLVIVIVAVLVFENTNAQKDSRIYFTTGVGVNKIKGSLHNVFKSTVAFNSALEVDLRKGWYAQAELNFNTLKYNQQQKDDNSTYLFHNTNSSLLLIGLNGGRDFKFDSPWFVSVYAGTGFISVGEPRISINEDERIVTQTAVRKAGIFGKGGTRVGYKTKSKIFHTLYIDASYWTSSIKTQGATLHGLSAFAGIRMAM